MPPKIVPILDILLNLWADKYKVEENFVIKEPVMWEKVRKFKATSNIPITKYIQIIKRLLKLKMILLKRKDQIEVINGLQCVWKQDGQQRLIFYGRPVNMILQEPDKVELPDFGFLKDWKVDKTQGVSFGRIDIDNYYHRLRILNWLHKYLALPGVKATMLGLKGDVLYLVCCTLLMVLSHSVVLAKITHMFMLKDISFAQKINIEIALKDTTWVLFYVDDIIIATKSTTQEDADEKVNTMVNEILEVYVHYDMHINPRKVVVATSETEGLGCALSRSVAGIAPIYRKMEKLVSTTRFLITQDAVRKRWIENILGHWVWYTLLFRPFFAVLFHAYRWLNQNEEEDNILLWKSVKREFLLLIGFANIIKISWALEDADITIAVDASQKGAGACEAELKDNWRTVDLFNGKVDWSNIIQSQWIPVLNREWKLVEHINMLELRALICSLLDKFYSQALVGKKLVVFSDSQVVVAAISKGRSSAYMLCCLLRRLTTLLVCLDAKIVIRWIPTHDNPADVLSHVFPCLGFH